MTKDDSNKVKKIHKNLQELENFILSKDIEQFSSLILNIATLCSEYYEACHENMQLMPENKFYDLVNANYLQLKKY